MFIRRVIVSPSEDGYTAEVPSLPGCVTEGDTIHEALENARDAIHSWIYEAEGADKDIPRETFGSDTYMMVC